jgi:hypothetical protein
MQDRQIKSGDAALSAAWVVGYLSGLNMRADHDALAEPDLNGLLAWIDNHCRANPLDTVATAAFKLFKELQSRAQRR